MCLCSEQKYAYLVTCRLAGEGVTLFFLADISNADWSARSCSLVINHLSSERQLKLTLSASYVKLNFSSGWDLHDDIGYD